MKPQSGGISPLFPKNIFRMSLAKKMFPIIVPTFMRFLILTRGTLKVHRVNTNRAVPPSTTAPPCVFTVFLEKAVSRTTNLQQRRA